MLRASVADFTLLLLSPTALFSATISPSITSPTGVACSLDFALGLAPLTPRWWPLLGARRGGVRGRTGAWQQGRVVVDRISQGARMSSRAIWVEKLLFRCYPSPKALYVVESYLCREVGLLLLYFGLYKSSPLDTHLSPDYPGQDCHCTSQPPCPHAKSL